MIKPPALAVLLIKWRVPPEDRDFVLGDLNERFDDKARTAGKSSARAWCWREAISAWTTRWSDHSLEIGNTSQGESLMQTIIQDLRWTIKILRASPVVTAAVVATLALAIGANTTIFSWINRVLMHPLPGVEIAGLVEFNQVSQLGPFNLSYPDYLDYRTHATKVMLAGREEYPMNLTAGDET